MNMLGNLNHVFFFLWVKINTQACSSYMCEIIFHVFFFLKAKKKIHACLNTYVEFFDQIWKISESPHKSYEHTWFFFNSQNELKKKWVWGTERFKVQTERLR